MNNEQILLFKDSKGNYIPYDRVNDELCVLIGSKEKILKRLKESIKLYTKVAPEDFIDDKHITVEVNDKYAVYDLDTKELITDFYDYIGSINREGFASFNENDSFGIMDIIKNKVISSPYWKGISPFSEGFMMVKDPETNKWGYLNEKFEQVIDCKFEEAKEFHDGMAVVGKKITKVEDLDDSELALSKEEKELMIGWLERANYIKVYGYINKKGELTIPYKYATANKFSEDMAFTQTFEELSKNYHGGAFIDKTNKRYRYFKEMPTTHFHNGESLGFVEGGHNEADLAYAIDKNMNIREVSLDYYFSHRYLEEETKKEREYEIVPDNSKKYYTTKLMRDNKEEIIDISRNIEEIVMDFYENGRLDGNVYAYNLQTNEIVPLTDFVIGSRNVLSDEEVKPYVRKKKLN